MRLTRQLERDLSARARAGDRSAADILARAVVPLVWHHAHRLHGDYPAAEVDELAGCGLLAVARAIPLFDPDLGNRWSTYAATAAIRDMARQAREIAQRADRFPRDRDEPEPDDLSRPDAPADPGPVLLLLDALEPIPKRVVELRFGIGCRPHTVMSLARHLGMGRARAQAVLDCALARLRRIAGERPYNT